MTGLLSALQSFIYDAHCRFQLERVLKTYGASNCKHNRPERRIVIGRCWIVVRQHSHAGRGHFGQPGLAGATQPALLVRNSRHFALEQDPPQRWS